ncbi:MAG: aldo/keto reductase [Bacteroidales bacterium]|nr:aldo/keto reductase [Bacteroidales bacterium]
MKEVKLNNGVMMPQIGYGVFQVSPQECERCVSDAIKVGYRMIDTAQAYMNEEGVGNAIQKSGVDRKEIFVVSKIWMTNYGYEKAKTSIDNSLRLMKTDYIDLMLLHQPFADYYGAYRAMEEAYKEGKLRAIGVSNFYADRFIDLANNFEVKPAVNQMETHVFCQQEDLQKYLKEFDTYLMAWGPLAEGKNNFFTNPILEQIGKKYGKSVAQTALKYLLQKDVIIIPKSTHIERMQQNLDLFDFELSKEDMEIISSLDEKHSLVIGSHQNPEVVKFFMSILK